MPLHLSKLSNFLGNLYFSHYIESYCDFTAGVLAQEEDPVTATVPPVEAEAHVRGDMIPQTPAPGKSRCPVCNRNTINLKIYCWNLFYRV